MYLDFCSALHLYAVLHLHIPATYYTCLTSSASMAFPQIITVLAIALVFSKIELSVCSEVKGAVSCTDCEPNYDLSGIKVLVKCDQVKKLSSAITNKKGVFEAALPSNAPYSQASASPNCLAKLLGGPSQLFVLKQNVVSKIVTARGGKDTYSTLTPLVFSKSCHGKCGSLSTSFGSLKTFDLPIPPEYGLPPTSLYTPFIPIIGIP